MFRVFLPRVIAAVALAALLVGCAHTAETMERELHFRAIDPQDAPPWMNQPQTYARIAEAHGGPMVYVSGLYGSAGEPPYSQLRTTYRTLERLLGEAGTDFNHLVKSTYYVTNEETDAALNEIRTEYYDPERAPTSSKMPVRGTGLAGTSVTFDMIGVVPPAGR